MLGKKEAIATIPVRDVKTAKKFYENVLGLKLVGADMPEAPVYESGGSKVLVYQSEYAGTNKGTAATWEVGTDIENVVQSLKAKGVTFEHYELPGLKRKDDIFVGEGLKAAWLKDPDGNILALVGE